ncbi:MAG TPA: T9SS type B sorting domain-containing protein [Bacteroidetes bacterium]|nr:T9SS type B sorting domain-containing protein [Bacteroidota bacterium]
MSALIRFLSFVPPILLFAFPAYAQLQGKLTQMPGTDTYVVSVIPTTDITLPLSSTSSAQITLRANSGKLNIADFQSLTGDWENQSQYISPVESPDYDYFRFFMINPLPSITFTTGVEVPLFSFRNDNTCTTIELVDNTTDPFVSNNSLMVDARNFFATLIAGPGGNAYEGNTTENEVDCPGLSLVVSAADNPVSCFGQTTNLTVQAVEGTEPYTVVYIHTPTGAMANATIPAFEGSTSFFNIPPGNYLVTITDSNDSTAQIAYNIAEPPPIVADLEPAPTLCPGSLNGAVRIADISGIGGTDFNAYQYYWNVDPTHSSIEIDSLDTGTYTVTIVDQNGCSSVSSTYVGVFNELFISKTIVDVSCFGENNGIIDITPFGLAPPYEYYWSPNAGVSATNQSAAWMLGPGQYNVTVTAAGGVCSHTESFTIEEPEEIKVTYEVAEPLCYGDDAFLNVLNVENAQGGYSLNITGEHTALTETNFEVAPGVPMQLVVTDDMGCSVSEDFLIPDKQEMTVHLGEDVILKYGETYQIDGEIFPLTGVELEWTPTDHLSCTDCPNPVASPTTNTTYLLRLTDADGCTAEDQINIRVEKSRDLYIPNAFSPNSDGINDIFRPYGGFEVVKIHTMQIYDRWGGLLFSDEKGFKIEDEKVGWNGFSNGKLLDPGTYLYTMNVEFIDGEIVLFAGEVNLMR